MTHPDGQAWLIVMMGTGTFAEPTLEALLAGSDSVVAVFTQPDREGVVKRGSTRQVGRGMKEIASEKNIPVFQPVSINTPEGIEQLRSVGPDLLVVAAYGQILSNEVLSIPRFGAINVHGSLLPKYRGAAPIAHAILNGETDTGVTIIRMSIGLDAGEMLAKASIAINDDTSGEVESRLAPIGAKLALETIARLKAGPISGEQQDKALVTKAPKLTKEMGLIDWTKPAEQVLRQVRAMQPWPTAYTYLHRTGKPAVRLLVNRLRASNIVPATPLIPGAIFNDPAQPKTTLLVATGNGAVEVVELQPAGKKRMLTDEFLRGHPCTVGDFFGAEQR
jgi:methionyl-tRNA formyltransferase